MNLLTKRWYSFKGQGQMVKDIAGEAVANGYLTETGKSQKTVIRNRIAGHGVDTPDLGWRPRWMQIPASHYFDKASCPPSKSNAAVSKVMMPALESKDKIAA